MADLFRLSKFLALVLRHRSEAFGLTLDEHGFTDLAAVWAQVQMRYPGRYTYDDLLRVVDGGGAGKKRYEIVGDKIRAMVGHSAVRPIMYEAAEPPQTLYHGTTIHALEAIRREGLTAQKRQYVHLTVQRQLAETVAARHAGESIILTVRAADAHRAGVTFYHPDDVHFLARAIPPAFIDFPA
ncbi:MAG: RNA 2'-phosphotransferase [bacterium]|nr:RNA 2'-phosphotransferase [bacterium]